ncbi:hypothetical protein M3672_09605 [Microbacterium enclense]|uniref:Capsular polysaccharide biosynthesis protein n=1 Tax=Microbacterium enclense TaxID=993073 RepID=A0A1G6NPD0_9MICO|nr:MULTISPECIES: hypothetical protein [Microbacterium]KSU52846.1 hypothetical protein AS029_12620 [Microbacterium enclense]MCM3614689.1 hypothetical protein [Microbacterium enclense]SDC69619.1 hypothetical protein SAMN05216418_2803 [Microbacterium enclense]
MEIPKYLLVLWKSKWLLVVGALVAAVAAFFAGFTIVNGQVEPRAEQSYRAGTTLLLNGPDQPLYQAVIPGQELQEGQTQPQNVDLTSRAILYAYLISGRDMRATVESQIGAFSEEETLTALRRTTQPAGDESFAGRYVLPILEVVGTATSPERAEQISRVAAQTFEAQVVTDQNAAEIPEDNRVVITTIDEKAAAAVEGSNPAIPVVVTFLGVFLLFVAAAYIIAGSKASRERKRAIKAGRTRGGSTTAQPAEDDAEFSFDDLLPGQDPDSATGANPSRVRSRSSRVESAPLRSDA